MDNSEFSPYDIFDSVLFHYIEVGFHLEPVKKGILIRK